MRTRVLFISAILIIVISGYGCKTRQVLSTKVKSTTESNTQVHKDSTATKVTASVDSSKSTKQITSTRQDSSGTKTTLTPVAGSKTIIHPDGTIEGEFTNVQTESHSKSKRNKQVNSSKQNAIATTGTEQQKVTTDLSNHTIAKKDSLNKQIKSDSTLKANVPTWLWILVVVLVLGVIAYVVFRVKAVKNLL